MYKFTHVARDSGFYDIARMVEFDSVLHHPDSKGRKDKHMVGTLIMSRYNKSVPDRTKLKPEIKTHFEFEVSVTISERGMEPEVLNYEDFQALHASKLEFHPTTPYENPNPTADQLLKLFFQHVVGGGWYIGKDTNHAGLRLRQRILENIYKLFVQDGMFTSNTLPTLTFTSTGRWDTRDTYRTKFWGNPKGNTILPERVEIDPITKIRSTTGLVPIGKNIQFPSELINC